MTTYQGHHQDGSSIQKHSAGGAYPYVLVLRDGPTCTYWELIGPGIDGALRFSSSGRWDDAVRAILAVRENEDAWAFQLERLQLVFGQKLMPMQAAAERLAGGRAPEIKSAKYASMSRVERVRSLLKLGAVRNTLRLPPGTQSPGFAELAATLIS